MLQCPSQINVFICFENKNIGVLHSTFYFKSFPISYHNVGGGGKFIEESCMGAGSFPCSSVLRAQ